MVPVRVRVRFRIRFRVRVRLSPNPNLVADDVVDGEEDEGHVDEVEADRGDEQHLAPAKVEEVLAHLVRG